jgi:shikimate kinase
VDSRRITKVEEIEHRGLVYLIGPSGSGKSTLAKKWANRLGLEHVDLDQMIEILEGQTIANLFKNLGEDHFRELEQKYLRSISSGMVACGGGTPLFHNNMDWMLNTGTVVWINLSPEMAWSRVSKSADRPLVLLGKENFIETMKSRENCYSRANFVLQL